VEGHSDGERGFWEQIDDWSLGTEPISVIAFSPMRSQRDPYDLI
jgi:hypothetical protein